MTKSENERHEDRVAILLDEQLLVTLFDDELTQELGLGRFRLGQSLTEGMADEQRVRRHLQLLLDGVARSVRFRSPFGTHLVATRTVSEHDRCRRWIVVRSANIIPGWSAEDNELVGREASAKEFEEYLLSNDRAVLLLEGSIGIGKTALLDMFARLCCKLGCPSVRMDGRADMLRQRGALAELVDMISRSPPSSPLRERALLGSDQPWVLLVDNLDGLGSAHLAPARLGLFDGLPAGCRVVAATRARANAISLISPSRPVRVHRVSPLSDTDALVLADSLGIEPFQRREVLPTYGHPLSIHALAGGESVETAELDRTIATGEIPISWTDIKIAALLPRLNEYVLGAVVGDEPGPARVYDALTALCFPDQDGAGLRMPRVYRRALLQRLQRRDPRRVLGLRSKLIHHYLRGIQQSDAGDIGWMVNDLIEMLREAGALGTTFDGDDSRFVVDMLQPQDDQDLTTFYRDRDHVPRSKQEVFDRLRRGVPTYAVKSRPASSQSSRNNDIYAVAQLIVLNGREALGRGDPESVNLSAAARRLDLPEDAPCYSLLSFEASAEEAANGQLRLHLLNRLLWALHSGAQMMVCPTTEPLLEKSIFVEIDCDGHPYLAADLRNHDLSSIISGFVADHTPTRASDGRVAGLNVEDVRLALVHLDQPLVLRNSALRSLASAQGLTTVRELIVKSIDNLARIDVLLHSILVATYLEKSGTHEQIARTIGIPYGTFRRKLVGAVDALAAIVLGATVQSASGGQQVSVQHGSRTSKRVLKR